MMIVIGNNTEVVSTLATSIVDSTIIQIISQDECIITKIELINYIIAYKCFDLKQNMFWYIPQKIDIPKQYFKKGIKCCCRNNLCRKFKKEEGITLVPSFL